jgi:4'-phosphopantetheinyl transferase
MSQVVLHWPVAPWKPELTLRDVHVWCVSLDQEQSRVEAWYRTLSADEQTRAGRFYFARDRCHYIVGRGVLRNILGRYLDLQAQELCFSYGPKGKPGLAPGLERIAARASGLRFNLSHSGLLALYGFTYGRDIGVDIEKNRPLEDAERIATRFFAAAEVEVFCALPEPVKLSGFFNCWTRKEAYIKATGDGLSMPLDRFEVSLVPGEPARFLHAAGNPREARRWSLRELEPAPGYTAAMCVEGQDWRLHCWQWSEKGAHEAVCH